MNRRFYVAGFAFGLTGVILGAFATHGLQPLLSPRAMSSFETGINYQVCHSFLLLILGNMQPKVSRIFSWVFYLIIAGIIVFSGSIYLLATNTLTQVDFRFLGPITPLGGSLLILSWIILLVYFIKLKNE